MDYKRIKEWIKNGLKKILFTIQKQSFPDVFQNRCSQKIRKFQTKKFVLESLF